MIAIGTMSEEAHCAQKLIVAQHNRSHRAEMRTILEAVAPPEGRLLLGTALSEVSKKINLTNADFEALEQNLGQVRDSHPAEPIKFE